MKNKNQSRTVLRFTVTMVSPSLSYYVVSLEVEIPKSDLAWELEELEAAARMVYENPENSVHESSSSEGETSEESSSEEDSSSEYEDSSSDSQSETEDSIIVRKDTSETVSCDVSCPHGNNNELVTQNSGSLKERVGDIDVLPSLLLGKRAENPRNLIEVIGEEGNEKEDSLDGGVAVKNSEKTTVVMNGSSDEQRAESETIDGRYLEGSASTSEAELSRKIVDLTIDEAGLDK